MFSEALKKGAKGWLSLEPCSLTAHSSRLGIHIVPPSQEYSGCMTYPAIPVVVLPLM